VCPDRTPGGKQFHAIVPQTNVAYGETSPRNPREDFNLLRLSVSGGSPSLPDCSGLKPHSVRYARLPGMPLIIILIVLLLLFGGGGYYMGPGVGYYGGGGISLILLIVILFLLFGRGRRGI
jgi:hypothetical protein